ncbi:MAG: hypothetical protein RLP14_01085 [Owenweeksia sp.]
MREINIKALLCTGLLFLGVSFSTTAQHNSIMVGGGLSTMLGDADLNIIDWDSYGYSITARYIHPFKKNDRWNYTLEYSTASMTQRGFIATDLYKPKISQTYVGVGCRFYIFNTIREYNPYFMELLPFIQASAGVLSHSVYFAEPYANSSDFGISEGEYQGATLQFTGGILIVLDKHWGLEGYAGFRYDPVDEWDGLKGNTSLGDVFSHGGIGLNYAF